MTTPNFLAIDVETTLNGNEDVGLAHPMIPENRVVAYGTYDGYTHNITYTEDVFEFYMMHKNADMVLCGHNIAFDLMYLYKMHPALKGKLQQHKIWDTQLAEYILTAQRSKFSSLDELSIKYKLPIKDDKISKYFKAGLGADKIPQEELTPYLQQDVTNTYKIAAAQYELAAQQGQLQLIQSQMEAQHATIEMMFNGLNIDTKRLDEYTVEVVDSYVEIKLDLEESVKGLVEDINSPKQWSQFFFGGSKKVKVKEAVGLFKNGNTKYKLVEKTEKIKPFIDYKADPEKVSVKTGQVSVDDFVLNDMLKHTFDPKATDIITKLLKYRELSKQLSTYVQGLSKHIINGTIHGKLNHTATVTGRLSSTNPNLQNISNNPIKQIFTSRFGDEGVIVEFDFNQLEVVALAHVTKDRQLIYDIVSGVDIHSALYKDMFGRLPTKEERKPFKSRTFQLIYGAGAKAISKQAGCSLEEAKRFITVFYGRYKDVAKWHTEFAATVERCATNNINEEGIKDKFRSYTHQTETGRRYHFSEYYNEAEWSTRMYNFSPTEMKNYPVQGLATGDIVPMMLGILFRKLVNKDYVKMVNTVHDSIMFDVHVAAKHLVIEEVLTTLQNTHVHFFETFGKPLALKLNAGASVGKNWFNMEELK